MRWWRWDSNRGGIVRLVSDGARPGAVPAAHRGRRAADGVASCRAGVCDNGQSMDAFQTDKPRRLQRLQHEVHVWLARPEDVLDPAVLQQYLALLSGGECERYRQFRFDPDRRRFLVSHALVRRVLSAYVDVDPSSWQFSSNQHGRPEISAPAITPPLRFNLTHTTGLVACVVSLELDCGIDVEQVSPRGNLSGIAEKMFAVSEQQALQSLDGQAFVERFFCYWTLREAYCKALGVGIAAAKKDHCFVEVETGQWTIRFDSAAGDNGRDWQFELTKPTADHVAAVALRVAGAPAKAIIHTFVVP